MNPDSFQKPQNTWEMQVRSTEMCFSNTTVENLLVKKSDFLIDLEVYTRGKTFIVFHIFCILIQLSNLLYSLFDMHVKHVCHVKKLHLISIKFNILVDVLYWYDTIDFQVNPPSHRISEDLPTAGIDRSE